MLSLLFNRFGAYIATAGAFLVSVAGIYFAGKRSGSAAARMRAIEGDLSNAQVRNAVERDTAAVDDPVGKLRKSWSRD